MVAGFKKRLWTQIGIAGGGVVLLSVFIIALNMDINKRDGMIAQTKDQLELRNRTIELLSSSNSDLKKAEPLLENLQTILPKKDQLITFPSELQKTAKGYGVEIGFTFGTEQPSTPSEPGSIKFSMTISGQPDDIYDFLKVVESHRYFIKLDSVDVRRSTKDTVSLSTGGLIYTN